MPRTNANRNTNVRSFSVEDEDMQSCPAGKALKECPVCGKDVCTGGPYATHLAQEHGVTSANWDEAKHGARPSRNRAA